MYHRPDVPVPIHRRKLKKKTMNDFDMWVRESMSHMGPC